MSTHTAHDQTRAVAAMLALVTTYRHLPAIDIALRDYAAGWGLRLAVHDRMTGFEQWREALDVDPARVMQHQAGNLGWLKLSTAFAGVPVELVGFYDLDDAERER